MMAVVTALALQLVSAAPFEGFSLLQSDGWRRQQAHVYPQAHQAHNRHRHYSLPLKVVDDQILDSVDTPVKFKCVNWYGAHMKQYVPNGLSIRSEVQIAKKIKVMGFNCVRLTFSTEMFIENPDVRPEYISKATCNKRGAKALDVFDAVVKALTQRGLAVIVNNHMHNAKWCCSGDDGNGIHYNADYSEKEWMASIVGMVNRYKHNERVIAFEPLNQPRPDVVNGKAYTWGETDAQDIASGYDITLVDLRDVYQKVGQAINKANPNALVVLSPIGASYVQCEWMLEKYPLDDLTGVVWAPHDSDFGITESLLKMCDGNSSLDILKAYIDFQNNPPQTINYYKEMSYEKFSCLRDQAYGHLAAKAPVFAGFGIGCLKNGMKKRTSQRTWWRYVRSYVEKVEMGFAYWSIDGEKWPSSALSFGENGTKSQDESWGLLEPNYMTVRRYTRVKQLRRLHPGVLLF